MVSLLEPGDRISLGTFLLQPDVVPPDNLGRIAQDQASLLGSHTVAVQIRGQATAERIPAFAHPVGAFDPLADFVLGTAKVVKTFASKRSPRTKRIIRNINSSAQ